jgi:hypothetical protein
MLRRSLASQASIAGCHHSEASSILLLIDMASPSQTLFSLHTSKRHVVQSHQGGSPSIFQRYKQHDKSLHLLRNRDGNYYRYRHQKLFRSSEALEVALTEDAYSPVERIPVPLLSPAEQQQQRHLQLQRTTRSKPSIVTFLEGCDDDVEMDLTSTTSSRSTPLLLQPEDLAGTPLESATFETISSAPGSSQRQRDQALSAEARDNSASHTTWKSLSPGLIDPVVANLAHITFGPIATRLQLRLMRALLNEDHNDVLLGGADGGGKTSALLLALLQGMRNESSGLNVLVVSNSINAKRASDVLASLLSVMETSHSDSQRPTESHGRPVNDHEGLLDDGQPMSSWLLVAPFREGVDAYAKIIKHEHSNRRVRLMITTADVFCELMFEHKTQFEHLGYLRRVYVDDCMPQLHMLPDHAPKELVEERLRNPVALEMLLGTLHQLAGPHIRSVMQIACVSAGLDTPAVEHLMQLSVKTEAKEVVLATQQLPSSIHCSFCFRSLLGQNRSISGSSGDGFLSSGALDDSAHPFGIYHHVAKVLWSAASTLCGRVVIFVRQEHDILAVRKVLRKLGMDVRLFSEVAPTTSAAEARPWKFVLMREHEGDGVPLPLVSHVVITFPPTTRQSFLHMSGRTGHLGSRGWVLTIADQRDARLVRKVVEELNVDFLNSVVELRNVGSQQVFEKIPASDVDRKTRDPALYGLDPQYAVLQQYDQLTEHSDLAGVKREFFTTRDPAREFYWEDYTPVPELHERHMLAAQIAKDVDRDPAVAQQLQEDGMLDHDFKPTRGMRRSIREEAAINAGAGRSRKGRLLPDVIMETRDSVKRRMLGGRGWAGGRGGRR